MCSRSKCLHKSSNSSRKSSKEKEETILKAYFKIEQIIRARKGVIFELVEQLNKYSFELEDIRQELITKFIEKYPKTKINNLTTYLFSFIKNTLINMLNEQQADKRTAWGDRKTRFEAQEEEFRKG